MSINFKASCECGEISVSSRRDVKRWSQLKCNKCSSKVCVYKNDKLIHNHNNNFFNASCECGEFHFTDKIVPSNWSQLKCKKCDSKMIIKDQNKNIVYNFQTKKQKKQISIKKEKLILPKIQQENLLIQKFTNIFSNENEIKNPIKNDVFMGVNLYEQSLFQPSLRNEVQELFNFIMGPVM